MDQRCEVTVSTGLGQYNSSRSDCMRAHWSGTQITFLGQQEYIPSHPANCISINTPICASHSKEILPRTSNQLWGNTRIMLLQFRTSVFGVVDRYAQHLLNLLDIVYSKQGFKNALNLQLRGRDSRRVEICK